MENQRVTPEEIARKYFSKHSRYNLPLEKVYEYNDLEEKCKKLSLVLAIALGLELATLAYDISRQPPSIEELLNIPQCKSLCMPQK